MKHVFLKKCTLFLDLVDFGIFYPKKADSKKFRSVNALTTKDMFSWLFLFRWLHAILVRQFLTFIFLLLYLIFSTLYFLFFPFFDKRSVIAQEKNLVLQIFLFYFPQVALQFVLIQTWHWGNLCHYFLLMYLCLCRYLIILSILILCSKFH